MRNLLRRSVLLVIVLHGLIHLLGAAKGLGWADVSALKDPIGTVAGLGWLAAAALLLVTAVLASRHVDGWWWVAVPAVVTSQIVIIMSWSDARTGTLANLLIVLAAAHGYAAHGQRSLRARYHREVEAALATTASPNRLATGPVTEGDLEPLPECVARYVRRSGAVGQPRIAGFRAGVHGRIRGGATQRWMPFTGEQVNTYGPEPTRQFFIDATRSGLPVDVLHVFSHAHASMQVRLASLAPLVDAHGPELDLAETVTVFNDLCVLAPAALVDAPVTWQDCREHTVRAAYTLGGRTITADLTFNTDDELVDFVSHDRSAASADGRTFTPRRWSTPLQGYRDVGARHVAVDGEARWHAAGTDGAFTYLDFHVDQLDHNVQARDAVVPTATPHAPAL